MTTLSNDDGNIKGNIFSTGNKVFCGNGSGSAHSSAFFTGMTLAIVCGGTNFNSPILVLCDILDSDIIFDSPALFWNE